ncbi:MAG: hypothetical protein ACRD19_06250 [Terriglobia bacterium]
MSPSAETPTSGGAAAPAASTAVDFGAIDRALQSLTKGHIVFNAPDAMTLESTPEIRLLLSPKESIQSLQQSLQQQIQGQQNVEGATIGIAPEMEARLTGENFAITAVTPETQAVSGQEETEWRWDVKPQKAGTAELHLTLSAILQINGSSMPRSIQTFDKRILVQVTWDQRISGFVSGHWDWLWTVVIIPIGAWIWNKKRKRRRKGADVDI